MTCPGCGHAVPKVDPICEGCREDIEAELELAPVVGERYRDIVTEIRHATQHEEV